MLLATIVGAVLVGAAVLTTEGCGGVPAGVGVQVSNVDAGLDGAVDQNADSGSDGAIGSDVEAGSDGAVDADADATVVCGDAGSFITIDGDGPTQTLRSNGSPSNLEGIPRSPWAQAYYGQGLSIAGSEDPDGGASVRFDVEIAENPDAGLTVLGAGSGYRYAYYIRHDGTLFSPTSALAASITLTEADPPGGIVAGSYTVTVVDAAQPDAGSLSLSGTFLTCRLPDYSGPLPPQP
jgi:hypothetical protein